MSERVGELRQAEEPAAVRALGEVKDQVSRGGMRRQMWRLRLGLELK